MKPIIILSLLISITVSAKINDTYECTPEIGNGYEVITIKLYDDKASILIDENIVRELDNLSYQELGEFQDYGEAQLVFKAKSGVKFKLINDYDEIILDIHSLDLGLSDKRYICH